MGKREFLFSIVHYLLKALTKTSYEGMEYLPPSGGVLIATNHLSRLDIPVLLDIPARPDITCVLTTKYKKNLLIAPLAWMGEAIWIDRDIADFTAIKIWIGSFKERRLPGGFPGGHPQHHWGLAAGQIRYCLPGNSQRGADRAGWDHRDSKRCARASAFTEAEDEGDFWPADCHPRDRAGEPRSGVAALDGRGDVPNGCAVAGGIPRGVSGQSEGERTFKAGSGPFLNLLVSPHER